MHSIAFAEREDLSGRTIDTSRAGFQKALDISAYSLIALARAAEPLMREGGSILAMTYYGSTKVLPSYNVMGIAKAALEASVRYVARDLGAKGIRVNAISAGPIKTLAASGVSGFRSFLDTAAERAPLRRNVSTDDVGNAAVYLLSASRRRRHRRGPLRRRRPLDHRDVGPRCGSSSATSAASSTRPRWTRWRASSSRAVTRSSPRWRRPTSTSSTAAP